MTQKPLSELIPAILNHYRTHEGHLEFNHKLYRILEGQLREEVEKSLAREVFSQSALRRIKERIPPVNVLRRTADKLSKVYFEPPLRRALKDTDQAILDRVVELSEANSVLALANFTYNAMRSFALEPYLDNGKQKIRVLSPHQFLAFSDDPADHLKMTVFIKLLGSEFKTISQRFDERGNEVQKEEIRQVSILALYSADEFMIIDTTGAVRVDKMAEMGVYTTVNPFGRIPFVYRSKSKFELVPYPNQEGYDISVLIPKLLADLNYAAQFMSHSIIWTKNANLEGQELNPDAVVNLGDSTMDGQNPEIGAITPSVDIANVLNMIEFELNNYFNSVGIKSAQTGRMTNGRDASGIAKALDESDISTERKIQVEMFRSAEKELWSLVADMQDIWANEASLIEPRRFSSDFADHLNVVFGEMKLNKSTRQLIEEAEMLVRLGIMSKRQALKSIYPQMTDEQANKWLEELGDVVDVPPAIPPQNPGQFGPENQVATNQSTEPREPSE
jgi:hypothetical protein